MHIYWKFLPHTKSNPEAYIWVVFGKLSKQTNKDHYDVRIHCSNYDQGRMFFPAQNTWPIESPSTVLMYCLLLIS
uniref:Uncharacterized protein n=1 Tax=Anguilla anguilla TaxID=7936 RepID=A0A0E9QEX4_ANGAN